jgi:hypothetical protein
MLGQLALAIGEQETAAAAVWETLPLERRAQVTIALARMLAKLVEAGRDD